MEFTQCLFYFTLLLIACYVTPSGSQHEHRDPCAQHTVETRPRTVAGYFGSNSVFFPHEFREVYCNAYSSKNSLSQKFSTCAGGLYHCVTQYQIRYFLEMPNKDPISFSQFGIRQIKIAVGCKCMT